MFTHIVPNILHFRTNVASLIKAKYSDREERLYRAALPGRCTAYASEHTNTEAEEDLACTFPHKCKSLPTNSNKRLQTHEHRRNTAVQVVSGLRYRCSGEQTADDEELFSFLD